MKKCFLGTILFLGMEALCLAQKPTKSEPPKKTPPPPPTKEVKKPEEPKPADKQPDLSKQEVNLTPEQLIQTAYALLQQGQPRQAIDTFRLAIKKDPKSIQAFVGLAGAYMQAKQYPEAIESYRSAIELNPSVPEFYYNLAMALIEVDKFQEARNLLGRAVGMNEGDIRLRLGIAETYRREKDLLRAREAYVRAIGFGVGNPAAYNGLGNLNLQESRYQEALDCFDASLQINSDELEAQLGRSAALSGLERHADAIDAAQKVLLRIPNLPFGYTALGGAYEAKKEHLLAVAQYEKALERDKNDPYTWGNMGWSLFGAEQYDKALEVSRKALGIDPKLIYVRLNVGLIYAAQDKWQDSQKEYKEAIKSTSLLELRAGIKDVRDAMKKLPDVMTLRRALSFLLSEERRLSNVG